MNSKKKILFYGIALLTLVLTPFLTIPVYADDGVIDPEGSQLQTGGESHWRLERAFRLAGQAVSRAEKILERSTKGNEKLDKFIAKMKEEGKDTSALEAARKALQQTINSAQTHVQKARQYLSSHTGFDANGKVIEAEQARQTLKSINEEMKSFREDMRGSFQSIKEEVKKLRGK
jgi:hypothetical protein